LVFQRNGRVHLYRRGCQFSRLLAAEVCASAVVMLGRPCSDTVHECWLPPPFVFSPFTSPPVLRRVPSDSVSTLTPFDHYHYQLYTISSVFIHWSDHWTLCTFRASLNEHPVTLCMIIKIEIDLLAPSLEMNLKRKMAVMRTYMSSL